MPEVQPGDDLGRMLAQSIRDADLEVAPGDVLVIAQKIVSKAEGRLEDLKSVKVSERAARLAEVCDKPPALVELIVRESREILTWRPGLLITVHRLGMVMARILRENLKRHLGVDLGIIVSDSVGRPWRLGTVGLALGASGVPVLRDLRGRTDREGRVLETSETADADAMAAAAVLLMGETGEGRPAVLMQGVGAQDLGQSARDLVRPPEEDLFRPAGASVID